VNGAHDAFDRGNGEVPRGRRPPVGDVRSGDANDRTVEVVEHFVGDDRGQFRSPTAQSGFSSTVNTRPEAGDLPKDGGGVEGN